MHKATEGHGQQPIIQSANDVAPRGTKRPRDQLSQCDCDDIYSPLSKRINGLHLHHQHQHLPQHHGQQQQEQQQQQQIQQQHQTTFQERYPYAPSSVYYAQNHALFHLHDERRARMQARQQQEDTGQQPK